MGVDARKMENETRRRNRVRDSIENKEVIYYPSPDFNCPGGNFDYRSVLSFSGNKGLSGNLN
jgi:hypothetical protein